MRDIFWNVAAIDYLEGESMGNNNDIRSKDMGNSAVTSIYNLKRGRTIGYMCRGNHTFLIAGGFCMWCDEPFIVKGPTLLGRFLLSVLRSESM